MKRGIYKMKRYSKTPPVKNNRHYLLSRKDVKRERCRLFSKQHFTC